MSSESINSDQKADSRIATQNAGSIHVEGLTKVFDTTEGREVVFEDINLEVEPGTFVCLLGKSGSGKSTMLNIISGILEATSGQVRFETSNKSGEVEVGHVFQSPRLMPWDTNLQNIELVNKNNEDYTEAVGKKYLDLVGLSDQYNKFPGQLSGGQQQRVGIARALSIDPEVLLMDEPFSNLDEITAEELRSELLSIWSELNKTVFFITHDMTEAIQLADRLLMLGDGEIYGDLDVPLDRPRRIDSDNFLRFRQTAIDKFHSIDEEN
jgi:NitT/TauT family transport system ATP-binding protein